MASLPPPATCPISLEPIPPGLAFELHGTTFDLRSVLDMVLVQGLSASHPYTRQRLGLDDFRRVHDSALACPETASQLADRQIADWPAFFEHCRTVASTNATEMEVGMLRTAVQTAWSRILDGSEPVRDIDDVAEIVRFHAALYGEEAARRIMLRDITDRYAATTCIRELAHLNRLAGLFQQAFEMQSYRGSLLRSVMTFLHSPLLGGPPALPSRPLLGEVVERSPPIPAAAVATPLPGARASIGAGSGSAEPAVVVISASLPASDRARASGDSDLGRLIRAVTDLLEFEPAEGSSEGEDGSDHERFVPPASTTPPLPAAGPSATAAAAAAAVAPTGPLRQVLERQQSPEHQWVVLLAILVSAAAEQRLADDELERGLQRIRVRVREFLQQIAAAGTSVAATSGSSAAASAGTAATTPSIQALRSAHRTLNSAILMARELHGDRSETMSLLARVGGILDHTLHQLEQEAGSAA